MNKFQTPNNSLIISENYGFVKSNLFQNSLDLNQSNKKLNKKNQPKRKQLKRNRPKRNNKLKSNNLKNNSLKSKKKKKPKKKILSQKKNQTHWITYQNPLSTLKPSSEKSATLKTG